MKLIKHKGNWIKGIYENRIETISTYKINENIRGLNE